MTWYVVDGMDGSGKSTAAEILRETLEARGRRVLVITHPNESMLVGRLEQRFLRGDSKMDVMLSTLLYITDVLHSIAVMRGRKGRRYDDIVFVRYIMAVAYLPDRLSGKAYDIISRLLPMPDVAMLIDLDPEDAIGRIFSRGDELEVFETVDKLCAVRARMQVLSEGWVVVDNHGDMDSLSRQIVATIQEVSD